jgi:hypothetical protein
MHNTKKGGKRTKKVLVEKQYVDEAGYFGTSVFRCLCVCMCI